MEKDKNYMTSLICGLQNRKQQINKTTNKETNKLWRHRQQCSGYGGEGLEEEEEGKGHRIYDAGRRLGLGW